MFQNFLFEVSEEKERKVLETEGIKTDFHINNISYFIF